MPIIDPSETCIMGRNAHEGIFSSLIWFRPGSGQKIEAAWGTFLHSAVFSRSCFDCCLTPDWYVFFSHPLLCICIRNFSPSLSKILASNGQSLAGPNFFHIRVNMSLSSSLHVGLMWDLKFQRFWYLAVAVTDTDPERGLDRGLSWFVRLLGESSRFKGLDICSQ